MTIGSQCLSTQISTRLALSPIGLACCQLTNAQAILECASVVKVATTSALPDVIANTGRFFFIEDICAYRYSNRGAWVNVYDTVFNGVQNVIYTWGYNQNGALGNSTTINRSSPGTTSGGGSTWCQTSAGTRFSMAVKTDGTMWTWGRNSAGNLGDGTVVDRSSPGTTAGGGSTWCQASAGFYHANAIKTDGTLWSWGLNTAGRLGDGTTIGRSSPGTTAGGGTTWCQIGTYGNQSLAVKTDGTLWTWGCGSSGQLGDGTTVNRSSPGTTAGGGTTWCQTSTTGSGGAAVKTDGTLWTWGSNTYGRLGEGTTVNRSSPGTTAGGGTTWCNSCKSAGLKTDGTLWTWGLNGGSIGDGTTVNRSSPGTTAGGGTTWCNISAGASHTAAIKTDGTLWTWGYNGSGRLGDGTTVNRSSPATVTGGVSDWCAVSAGGLFTLAIQSFSKGFNQPT